MQDVYCNRVFLHSGTSTFTQVQDLSTSPTSAFLSQLYLLLLSVVSIQQHVEMLKS